MPKTIYYRERNKPLAQSLRREMTRHEKRLWYDYLNTCPVRFRRQKQFGQYIVDFYCAERKLVVEIDGSQHYEPEEQAKDAERTTYLESLGLRVMRFSNHDVDTHFNSVCETIDAIIRENP